jgi:hypothetical protein
MGALDDNSNNTLAYTPVGFGTGSVSFGLYVWQGFEHSFIPAYPLLSEQKEGDGSVQAAIYNPTDGTFLMFSQYLAYYAGVNPSHLPPYEPPGGGGGGEILI